MYNGIGLTTPRGSGTNGHVQRNWAFVRSGKKDNSSYATEDDIKKSEARLNRPPNKDILDHDRKRKIEVKCLEFEEILEKQGRTADEIKKKVDSYREKLLSQTKSDLPKDEFGRVSVRETHQLAEAQLEKNHRLREAFNIPQYFVDGSSFDSDKKEKEALLKSAALQKELELQRSTMTSVDEDMKRRYTMVRTPSKERDDNTEQERRVSSKSEKKKKRKRARDSSPGSPERKKEKKKKSKKSKKDSKKKSSRKRKISDRSVNESDNHSETNSDQDLDSKKARKKTKKDKRKEDKNSKKNESPVNENRSRKSIKERSVNSNRNNPFRNDDIGKNSSSHNDGRDESRSRKQQQQKSETRSRSSESNNHYHGRRRSRSMDLHKQHYIEQKSKRSPLSDHRSHYRHSDMSDLKRNTDKRRSKSLEITSKSSRRSSEEHRNNKQIRSSRGDGSRKMSPAQRSREGRNIKEQLSHSRSQSRSVTRTGSHDKYGEKYRRRRLNSHSRSNSRSNTRSRQSSSSRNINKHKCDRSPRSIIKIKSNPFKINEDVSKSKTPTIQIEKKRRSNSENKRRRSSSMSERDILSGNYSKKSNEFNKKQQTTDHKPENDKRSREHSNHRRSEERKSSPKASRGEARQSFRRRDRRSVSESRTPPYRYRQHVSPSYDREVKSEISNATAPMMLNSERDHTPPLINSKGKRIGISKQVKNAKSPESEPPTTPPLVKSICKTPIEEDNKKNLNVNSNSKSRSRSNSSELSYSPARKNPDRYKEILQNSSIVKKKKDNANIANANASKHIGDDTKKSRSSRTKSSHHQHHAPAACLQSNSSESDDDGEIDKQKVDKESSGLEEFQASKRDVVAIGEMAMLQQLAVKAREKIKSKEQLERQGGTKTTQIQNQNQNQDTCSKEGNRRKDNENRYVKKVSDNMTLVGQCSNSSMRNSLSEFLAANNVSTISNVNADVSSKLPTPVIDMLSTKALTAIPSTATTHPQSEIDIRRSSLDNNNITDTLSLTECKESMLPANGQGDNSPKVKSKSVDLESIKHRTTTTTTTATSTTTVHHEHTTYERKYNNNNSNLIRDHKTPPLNVRKSSYQKLNYHSSNNIRTNTGAGIPPTPSSSTSKYSLNNLYNKTTVSSIPGTATRKAIHSNIASTFTPCTSSSSSYHNRMGRVNNNHNHNQFAASMVSGHFSANQIVSNKNFANGNPIIIGRRDHQRQQQFHHYRSSNNNNNPHFANSHTLNTPNNFCSNNILLTNNNGGSNNNHHNNNNNNNNNLSNCPANCSNNHYHSNNNNNNNSNTYHHRSHHKDGHSHGHGHHHHSHHHHHHSHHQSHHHGSASGAGGNQLILDPMLVGSSSLSTTVVASAPGGGGGGGGIGSVNVGRNHFSYHISNAAAGASNSSVVAHQSNNFAVAAAVAAAAAAAATASTSSNLSYHHQQQQKQKIVIKPFKIHDPQPLASALADSALVDTIVSKVSTATVAAAAAAERERRSHSRPRRSRSNSHNGERGGNRNDNEGDDGGSHRSSSHSDYSRSSSSSSRFGSRSHSTKYRSRSGSQSSESSNSSNSSSQSSHSSASSRSGSRSPSIPRRRGSPSFLDRRRITSARKRPIPYHRKTPSDNSSYCSSCCSRAGSSPPSRSPTRSSHSPSAAF